MNTFKVLLSSIFCLVFMASCGGGSSSAPSGSGNKGAGAVFAKKIKLNGSGSSSLCNNVNEVCASVIVCVPNTNNCQTINNILVDTGSVGLRIFSQALTISLPQLMDGPNQVAECAEFGTGSDWGPVMTGDVVLAGEPAVTTAIQVINKTFYSPPSGCQSADTSPQAAGFNGILGVGLFQQDCGNGCAIDPNNQMYYDCANGGCTNSTISVANQLQNPVGLLPSDNNGVVINLPALDSSGDATATGTLTFGIGTQADNTPSSPLSVLNADGFGNMTVTLNGHPYSESFIDSGSNAYFLPASGVPTCQNASDFYCPNSTIDYSATAHSSINNGSSNLTIELANAINLFNTGNNAFDNISGPNSGGVDLGLPFFYGRPMYVGLEATSSIVGSGSFWAY
jgi:hypothetical protein